VRLHASYCTNSRRFLHPSVVTGKSERQANRLTFTMKLCFVLWLSTVSAFAPANVRVNRVRLRCVLLSCFFCMDETNASQHQDSGDSCWSRLPSAPRRRTCTGYREMCMDHLGQALFFFVAEVVTTGTVFSALHAWLSAAALTLAIPPQPTTTNTPANTFFAHRNSL
jgi:hypothetical protein